MRGFTTVLKVLVLLVIPICLTACGSSDDRLQPTSKLDIPWPPTGEAVKYLSDDSILLTGQDWSEKGGNSYNIGFPFALQLAEDYDLPWAIYSMAGFNPDLHFSKLTLTCEIRPTGPADGTVLYLGFANYATQAWEWFTPGDGIFEKVVPVEDEVNYISPAGAIHFVVVHYSPNPHDSPNGYTNIISLEIERIGDTSITPPDGLAAVATRNDITLSWQDVPIADGYHIYRDIHKDFPAPEKLTDGTPLTGLGYVDETVESGVMYYYKASSTRGLVESGLSNYVDIFCPESSRVTPTALGGYSIGPDNYIAQWSWEGSLPDYFWVYYSEDSDFNLDGLTRIEVSGIETEATLDLWKMAETVYWRVCAYQSGLRGGMTDDLAGQTTTVWEWGSTEVLGSGMAPISLVEVDGDYSAAYINGRKVDFSRRTAGTWDTETAMDADTFGTYLSISYGGGEYVIGVQDDNAHDLWIGTGTPGLWSSSRVHGTNSEGMNHPISGNSIQAASSDTQHVVIHSGEDFVMEHTKPAGSGSWSAPSNLWSASTLKDHMSMLELDSNFYLLWLDPNEGDLTLADKGGGWVKDSVLGGGISGIGEHNSLTRFNGEWWTPGHNSTVGERNIHFLNGTTTPWTEILHQDTGHTGEFASMAVVGTKLFCVYLRRDADQWEFSLLDGGSWETNWLILPGIEFSRVIAGAQGDLPYVLVDDITNGQIKAFTGTPPS